MEKDNKKLSWLEQFKLNYEGKSDEAKALEPHIKQTYKGNDYIPWATMERLVYMQDPDASLDVIRDDNGSLSHTRKYTIRTYNKNGDKEIETNVDVFTHFVIVKCKFLGKEIEETFPIQDNSYEAPKVLDANLVNKAIQRAKVKAASRVSGLALKIYEGQDLQFEDDAKETPKETPKTKTKPAPILTEPIVEKDIPKQETKITISKDVTELSDVSIISSETVVKDDDGEVIVGGADPIVLELANYLHKNEDVLSGIQKINTSVARKYGFTLDINDDIPTIYSKLSKVADPTIFVRSIKVQSGLPVE